MTTNPPLVTLRRLEIRFGGPASNPTVDGIDLDIAKGEMVALVGESGSGKSLVAHTLAGILTPDARLTAERFDFGGVDLARADAPAWTTMRGREVGIVFQNPRAALNPMLRIGRQLGDVIAYHRLMRGNALREATIGALAEVRIPDPAARLKAYPAELSGGMCQRVMLAIALAGNPALLVADEPTTGLDTTTQAAVLELIAGNARSRNMATLLITHDLALARAHADRIVVMHAGQIVEAAPVAGLFERPRHPYTKCLLGATPGAAATVMDLAGIAGGPPDLAGTPPACRFAERCDRALAICATDRPALAAIAPEHLSACWNPA
jgi:oligopeptide/dipeptide ABC transporter ATP-binding protein